MYLDLFSASNVAQSKWIFFHNQNRHPKWYICGCCGYHKWDSKHYFCDACHHTNQCYSTKSATRLRVPIGCLYHCGFWIGYNGWICFWNTYFEWVLLYISMSKNINNYFIDSLILFDFFTHSNNQCVGGWLQPNQLLQCQFQMSICSGVCCR